jgi:hypothetical protein
MSSSAVQPKKKFLCCPAPFGSCCGGSKSRKTAPPAADAKNDVKNDAKNGVNGDAADAKNGDDVSAIDDAKNPFLSDEADSLAKADNVTKDALPRPRKAMTPMASPAKVGFLVSFLVRPDFFVFVFRVSQSLCLSSYSALDVFSLFFSSSPPC